MNKTKKWALWLASLCVVASVVGLAACAPATRDASSAAGKQEGGASALPVATPEADEFGVVTAESWKAAYPTEYATYEKNESNSPDSGKQNYLEQYPALTTLYKGYAFSLGYDEAAGHLYSLQSVTETPRTTQKVQAANCISCKTPQFTAMVNSQGEGVYALPFKETVAQFNEPISCYNCHENDPQSLTVTNKFFLTSLGTDSASVPKKAQVCGQCHNEYYFDPDTKAPANPYVGTANMTPDAILAYYDAKGFSDWKYPGTDTPMIKVQHPEFETVYGGDSTYMAKLGFTCADCHMGSTTADDGTTHVNHEWTSPLENDELIESTCSQCHADIKGEVADIQAHEEDRVQSISKKIEDMANTMVEQVSAGTLTGDRLTQLQKLHRDAQFYWDFVMVENSEGAHNPTLTTQTLDKAEAAADEALALLK